MGKRAKDVEYNKTQRAADPLRFRGYYLKKTYGMSLDDYADLLEKQHGVCAICFTEPELGKVLDVDHCHTRGYVRALLCRSCNVSIGRMNEDPDRLRRAADYLEKHGR